MKEIVNEIIRGKRHHRRHLSLLFVLFAIFAPTLAYAQCTLSWTCGGGSAYSGSKTFPDKASCERGRSEALSTRHYQSGGGCSLGACVCSGAGSTGSGGAGAGISPSDQLMLDMSYQLGVAIGKSLLGGPRDKAAEEAERLRREEQTLQRIEELKRLEEGKKARFREEKAGLFEQFKGHSPSKELGWKKDEAFKADADIAFDEYHGRETERRKVFEQTSNVWCKLTPPLKPVRPIMPIPDDRYEQMTAYYMARKAEFDRRCKQMEQASANTPLEPWKETKAPPKPEEKQDKAVPLPISCTACWRNFDTDSGGCATLNTDIERLVCVNGALDKWTMCIGGCRTEPAEPVTIQQK